jgi:hypothetical protein
MRISIFKTLHAEGLIGEDAVRQVEAIERDRLFSLYWELRLLLYLGVLLLTTGLGILVYKHIDTIGHQAVLAFIAAVAIGSFFYCFRKNPPFSWDQTNAPDPFFDYVALLGCLSLLIFTGYLQFEFNVFGNHYGLATFIPAIILFWAAYYFDHVGVLSLAITNLAAWAGIAVTPLQILKDGNFGDTRLIFTGMLLGGVLLAFGHLSAARRIKSHFELTYTNFGLHLFFIAALAGLFRFDRIYVFSFAVLLGFAWFLGLRAFARRSFYFIVVIVLYAYVALSYVVLRSLDSIQLALLYFIFSATGMAFFLIHLNRQMKRYDRVQP